MSADATGRNGQGSFLESVGSWIAITVKKLGGKIASTVLLVLAWLLFFALANAMDSDKFAKKIDSSDSLFSRCALIAAVQYLICWTFTNVAILACIAAAVGESGRELVQAAGGQLEPKSDYRKAIVRGFFTYLAVVAGYVIVQGGLDPTPIGVPREYRIPQGTYTRIAIAVSLASFLAGYAPSYFLARVKKATGQVGDGGES